MEEFKVKNLYEKIQAVSNEIRGIEKDMTVSTGGSGSYQAVSDKSVILKVKAAETKHRLLSIPLTQELVNSEVVVSPPDSHGRTRTTYVDTIKMQTCIVDLDNPKDHIIIESFGRGVDSSDKGFGKAATYARKYALLNVYKIATGVDPDQEASAQIERETAKDTMRLEVENYLLKNDDYREHSFSHFGVISIDGFTDEHIKTIHYNLTKKGQL